MQFAKKTKGEIAYGVITGAILFIYVGINLIGDRQSRKGGVGNETPGNFAGESVSRPAES